MTAGERLVRRVLDEIDARPGPHYETSYEVRVALIKAIDELLDDIKRDHAAELAALEDHYKSR